MKGIIVGLGKLWNDLTAPSPELTGDERRKAATLAALLLIMLPLSAVTVFISPVSRLLAGEGFTMPGIVGFVALGIIGAAYRLSRTRYYMFASYLTVVMPLFVIAISPLTSGTGASPITLIFITLSVILSSLVLTPKDTLVVGIASVLLTLVLPISTTANRSDVYMVSSFVAVTTGIMTVVGRIRTQYVGDLEATQAELQRRMAEVDEARAWLEHANQEIEERVVTEQSQRQALQVVLQQMRTTAGVLNAAAAEILAASSQQVASTSEQESAVAQTVVTLEEVRTTVEQTTDRARQVADISRQSVEVSRQGENAVAVTVDSMARIKQQVADIAENILALSARTQQIGEIIDTVNALADQSKLLALNASIEAARAGEEGRGFAVVALEVRQLAEQSRQATARVRVIIDEIQQATNTAVMVTEAGSKGAESGMELVEQAGHAIRDLAATIAGAAQAATQIAASTQQQTSGMEQLSAAMLHIRTAATQTSASTRQMERSVQDLIDMAEQLGQAAERYGE
jgi:methyl-accepting chemotaxis protein